VLDAIGGGDNGGGGGGGGGQLPPLAGPGFNPISPVRVIDSRNTGAVQAGQTITVPLGSRMPAGATGVVLNVTAVDPLATGYLSVYPCGGTSTTVSNVNYVAGRTVPNAVIVGLGAAQSVCVFSSATTNVLVDLTGSFSGGFNAVMPERLLDTRSTAPVAASTVQRVQVAGRAGIPAEANTAALNVTAVDPSSGGFLTVFPCGERPNTSSVNFAAGQVAPNFVVTELSATGEVCVFASASTQLLVDAFGWFSSGFDPVGPSRLLDTRPNSVAAGSVTRVRVAGAGGVPADASAVALNLTMVDARGAGYATLFPCTATPPNTSTLNFAAGQTVANAGYVGLDATGDVCVFASVAGDLIVDVVGWFPKQ
jgi:hypothetical protein